MLAIYCMFMFCLLVKTVRNCDTKFGIATYYKLFTKRNNFVRMLKCLKN